MAKSNSNIETTNVERLEFFIIETLTNRGKVVIPDFGHLELKTVGDRCTVFFIPSDQVSGSFMQIMSADNEKEKTGANSLYTAVTIPLKAEKTVNLPKIGVFKPTKRDDGTIRVTFMPSSLLRKTLSEMAGSGIINKGETKKIEDIIKKDDVIEEIKEDINKITGEIKEDIIEEREEIKEAVTEEIKVDKTLNAQFKKIEYSKNETGESEKGKINEIKSDAKFKTNELTRKNPETTQKSSLSTPNWPKTTKTGETMASQANTEKFQSQKFERTQKLIDQNSSVDDEPGKGRFRNLSGTVLFFVALIAIMLCLVLIFRSCNDKKVDDQLTESTQKTKDIISLPALAEKHYGHSAFWAYIYEANVDKLASPLNIPGNISLVIPDLEVDYNVDLTDSLEIKRANILGDIILNRLKNKK